MIVQQTKKRNFDQYINYYPTSDDPSQFLINDDVMRHQENIILTSHPHTTNITPIQLHTHNPHDNNNPPIIQKITNPQLSEKNQTYTKRAPIKKIKNPYKGDHYTQQNRQIENIIDKDTIEALNHNIYNINTDYIKIGTINIQKGFQQKKEDLINFCIERSYHLLALTEIGKINNPTSKPHLTTSSHLNVNTDITQTYHTYTYNTPDNNNHGIGIIMSEHIAKHLIKIEGYEN
jgi:hypothetical protein